jgi:hypothetical protein
MPTSTGAEAGSPLLGDAGILDERLRLALGVEDRLEDQSLGTVELGQVRPSLSP